MAQFADLHCHPHLRSFNFLRNSRFERNNELNRKYYHPWHIIWSNPRPMEKGKRASAYSSCDMMKLWHGRVKLVFASLYPMEKGWFEGRDEISKEDVNGLVQPVSTIGIAKKVVRSERSRSILAKIGDEKGSRLGLRDFLQTLYMNIPMPRINFFQGHSYDYFEELNHEKDFLLNRNNQLTEIKMHTPLLKKIFSGKKGKNGNAIDDKSGIYKIAQNGADVTNIIHDKKIALILTIEGANVFNSHESFNNIKSNIDKVKNWKTTVVSETGLHEEPLPVFFISFAHHFNNYLCGHAHSIPDIGKVFIDQSPGLNSGFTQKGREIVRYILGLDENNRKDLVKCGRRILVDVKHMSAASRKWYYNAIIADCRNKGDFIPVIASHCGYSGKQKLEDLIECCSKECDKDAEPTFAKPFNSWNINLCDEDIAKILLSDGLIGINLDQRILGVPKKKRNRAYPENYDISFFWKNLRAMMLAAFQFTAHDVAMLPKIHELFCLGTDYDGYIDPIDKYPTVLKFEEFRADLIDEINHDESCLLQLGIADTEKFVDGICFTNAYNFVLKHMQ